jgi:hypothetical protein
MMGHGSTLVDTDKTKTKSKTLKAYHHEDHEGHEEINLSATN